ncbi:MAG: SH3 domain-containing protein [Tistlia sp.]|uniref:SH3 domain-containing protein n=1 Tax=Tistlia sp. TaxID=3057121 RepID=UPI0034A39F7D
MTNLYLEDDCRRTRWAVIRIDEVELQPEGARETAPPPPLPAGSWGGKLRAGPGTDYPQTGSLAEGERVTLLERTSVLRDGLPWFLIELSDGRTGYQWGGTPLRAGGAGGGDVRGVWAVGGGGRHAIIRRVMRQAGMHPLLVRRKHACAHGGLPFRLENPSPTEHTLAPIPAPSEPRNLQPTSPAALAGVLNML